MRCERVMTSAAWEVCERQVLGMWAKGWTVLGMWAKGWTVLGQGNGSVHGAVRVEVVGVLWA